MFAVLQTEVCGYIPGFCSQASVHRFPVPDLVVNRCWSQSVESANTHSNRTKPQFPAGGGVLNSQKPYLSPVAQEKGHLKFALRCCDKTLTKTNMEKKGFISVSRLQVPGYITEGRKGPEVEQHYGGLLFTGFPLLFVPGPPAQGWLHPQANLMVAIPPLKFPLPSLCLIDN